MNEQTLGRYTLIRKLATGGMAEVFLARADGPGGFAKRLVVKRILPQFCEDERFTSMFLSEATLAAQLNHPNLVQIFDFGAANGQYYLAMEFIDGPNLRALAQRAREFGQPLSYALCAKVVSLAAEGLQYAHDLTDDQGRPVNLVHRDISPDNLLVARSGSVKVVDFGIAKTDTQMHHTRSGVIKGKMAYMPPEQLNRQPLDRRTDVYALGVVLYELISGAFPFDATSEVSIIQAVMNQEPLMPISQRVANVPPGLEAIITRCLSKPKEGRFASCAELQRALEEFIVQSGQTVLPSDIAARVNEFYPIRPEAETIEVSSSKQETDEAFAPTFSKGDDVVQQVRRATLDQVPAAGPVPLATSNPRLSKTDLSAVSKRPASRTPLFVVGGLALVAVGVGVGVLSGRSPGGAPPMAEVDAGVTPVVVVKPVEPVVVDAGSVAAEVVDAGGAVAVAEAVDAGAVSTVDAGQPVVAVAKTARLELRIRPYADKVVLDGRQLGETPIPPVTVSVGPHKLTLVNTKLSATVNVTIVVPPSGLVYSRNLNE